MARLGDGRATSLIKRFEKMAAGGPAPETPVRPQPAAYRDPGPGSAGGPRPWMQARRGAGHAADDAQAPPLAQARSGPPSVPPGRHMPGAAGHALRGQALDEPATPPAVSSGLPAASPSRRRYASNDDGNGNDDDDDGSSSRGADSGLVAILERHAELDASLQCPPSTWLLFAERCIDEARTSRGESNAEDAFVRYKMACNVFAHKFQELRDRNAADNHPGYVRLRQEISTIVVDELDALHRELRTRTRPQTARLYNVVARREAQTRMMAAVQAEVDGARPARTPSAAPVPRPMGRAFSESSSTSGSAPSTRPPSLNARALTEARRSSIDTAAQQPPQPSLPPPPPLPIEGEDMFQGVHVINRGREGNRAAVVVAPDLPAIDEGAASTGASPEQSDDQGTSDAPAPSLRRPSLAEAYRRMRQSVDSNAGPEQGDVHDAPEAPAASLRRPSLTEAHLARRPSADGGSEPEQSSAAAPSLRRPSLTEAYRSMRRSIDGGAEPEHSALPHSYSGLPRRPSADAGANKDSSSNNAGDEDSGLPLPLRPTSHLVRARAAVPAIGLPRVPPSTTHGRVGAGRAPIDCVSPPDSPLDLDADPVQVGGAAAPSLAMRPLRPPPPIPRIVPPAAPWPHAEATGMAARGRPGHAPPLPPGLPLPVRPAVGSGGDDALSPSARSPRFYRQSGVTGSDPSLNSRLQSGGNPRNSGMVDQPQQELLQEQLALAGGPEADGGCLSPGAQKRMSQLSESGTYGVTGLGNFGNTCFMNSVLQCLVGTDPLTRFFMRGEWQRRLIQAGNDGDGSNSGGGGGGGGGARAQVTIEYARLVETLWRGQHAWVSPAEFRAAVGVCSEQFGDNDQEDAHEFASFLLDTLHESLNHVHPRPPPEREPTPEEELQFEELSDGKQALLEWRRSMRRDWSVVSKIFQGQVQSRLTCMACSHTSTTYHTFTELSVPIPAQASAATAAAAAAGASTAEGEPKPSSSGLGFSLLRRNKAAAASRPASQPQPQQPPLDIYQCLAAYSETEILDGDNMWMCPKCKAKRKASKRLLISRLPDVLTVHLKRFSTVGHFREKLEANVQVPTRGLDVAKYVVPGPHPSTTYNLYGAVNHYGTLSSGHYTASVYSKARDQWHCFDDTRVTQIAETQVATPAAYLLFFVQV